MIMLNIYTQVVIKDKCIAQKKTSIRSNQGLGIITGFLEDSIYAKM